MEGITVTKEQSEALNAWLKRYVFNDDTIAPEVGLSVFNKDFPIEGTCCGSCKEGHKCESDGRT